MNTLNTRILAALSYLASFGLLGAGGAPEPPNETADWQSASPRDEIRPKFEFKQEGGPAGGGGPIIRADEGEGVDGHLVKNFSVQGGPYYHFRALRRIVDV